jgi:hypothetical protein
MSVTSRIGVNIRPTALRFSRGAGAAIAAKRSRPASAPTLWPLSGRPVSATLEAQRVFKFFKIVRFPTPTTTAPHYGTGSLLDRYSNCPSLHLALVENRPIMRHAFNTPALQTFGDQPKRIWTIHEPTYGSCPQSRRDISARLKPPAKQDNRKVIPRLFWKKPSLSGDMNRSRDRARRRLSQIDRIDDYTKRSHQ